MIELDVEVRRRGDAGAVALQARPTILVAEDDDDLRDYLCCELLRDNIGLIPVDSGAAAIAYIDRAFASPDLVPVPDLLITDLRMPDRDGFAVVESASVIPAIVITGFPSSDVRQRALALGASYVFAKPFDCDDLRTAVRSLIDVRWH